MAVKAPVVGADKTRDVTLEDAVFAADLKPHLVHEAVRAELNAHRAGTRAAKSRGLVSGGRSKPWRQKGTGRARQGTTRAPQFTGGGVVFPPGPRSFEVKVNRKAAKSALRSALSAHASEGTLGIIDAGAFDTPSTKAAAAAVAAWDKQTPLVVVCEADEETVAKSFRNLDRTVVVLPSELEVAAVVWANSLLVTERALELVQKKGGLVSLHPNEILLAPVVSEKSYGLIEQNKYAFKVHKDAHKTQVRQAVEQLFEVRVEQVNIVKMPSKPKRRGAFKGTRPGWKKAIVQLHRDDKIEIFEGAQV